MNNTAKIMDCFKESGDFLTPEQVSEKTNVSINDTKFTIDLAVKKGMLLWSIFEGTYKINGDMSQDQNT